MRRAGAVIAAILVVLLSGACRVETNVGVRLAEDGSGEISVAVDLDAAAVKRAGNLAAEIRTADLEEAGWEVDGPTSTDDGGARLVVRRSFLTPAEGEAVFRSLATEESPFGAVRIKQSRGWWSTTSTFEADVDLSGGLAALGDQALTDALEGQPLGVPLEALEQQLGQSLDRVFALGVAVRLPGDVDSNAPQRLEGGARWSPKLGESVSLRATSTAVNRPRIALTVVAATSGLGAVALAVAWARRRRSPLPLAVRPHREDGPGDDAARAAAAGEGGPDADEAADAGPSQQP